MEKNQAEATAGTPAGVREERRPHSAYEQKRRGSAALLILAEQAVTWENDGLLREAIRRRGKHSELALAVREQWGAERRPVDKLLEESRRAAN